MMPNLTYKQWKDKVMKDFISKEETIKKLEAKRAKIVGAIRTPDLKNLVDNILEEIIKEIK